MSDATTEGVDAAAAATATATVAKDQEDHGGARQWWVWCRRAAALVWGCVLTLCASLSKGAEIVEQSQIPVYVGVKGMLEAAF